MANESLIESSTKIVYSVKDLSGDLKVYWSRFLSFSFQTFTQSQIQQREITAASNPCPNQEDTISFFKSLSEEERVWVMASLKLLLKRAEAINDWISHRNLDQFIKQFSLPELISPSEEKFEQIQSDFLTYDSRNIFILHVSISIISLVYFF